MSEIDYSLDVFLDEIECDFQSFGEVYSPYYDYIKEVARKIPGGANIIGDLDARLKVLWSQTGAGEIVNNIMTAPGSKTINYGDNNNPLKVGLGLPVDYDIWYLFWAGNILRRGHSDFTPEEWITRSLEKLEDYIKEIDSTETLKALKQPVEDDAKNNTFSYLSGGSDITSGFSGMVPGSGLSDNIADWKYIIKEARFEMVLRCDSTFYPAIPGANDSAENPPSPRYGPKGAGPQSVSGYVHILGLGDYVGYIAFPVGPLGVMWKIVLTTESSLASGISGSVHPADEETKVVSGNELLPPFDLSRSEVAGAKLIEKGYVVADDTTVELLADPFPDIENPPLHYWMRYWIKTDNVEIIPGELVALVCRPWPLHCWWYQESSPFIYAGNWIETEFYTSGIVKEVLEPWQYEDVEAKTPAMPSEGYYDPDKQVGGDAEANHYRVWVKNEELILESSDFYEYEVDERVGILKTWRDSEENDGGYVGTSTDSNRPQNFNWMDLVFFNLEGKTTTDDDLFITDWVIIPTSFYESGNSVGGA